MPNKVNLSRVLEIILINICCASCLNVSFNSLPNTIVSAIAFDTPWTPDLIELTISFSILKLLFNVTISSPIFSKSVFCFTRSKLTSFMTFFPLSISTTKGT